MKNKKRVLIILSILIIILAIFLAIVLIFGSRKAKELNEYEEQIEAATCEFGVNNNYTEEMCYKLCPKNIYFSELLEKGYIEDLVNPVTGVSMSEDTSSYVTIEYVDGEMVCTINER